MSVLEPVSAPLREDDPRLPPLLAADWTVRERSWGARLRLVDDSSLAV